MSGRASVVTSIAAWLVLLASSIAAEQASVDLTTSFEKNDSGEFKRITTEVGVWTASPGNVGIDAHHRRTGRQCLHLFGGDRRSVEVTFKPDDSLRVLTFFAERWTKRSPFTFRVEQSQDQEQWKEVYNGDNTIRIGGFLTKVSIPIDRGTTRLRLTCTSPADSGVLVDDVSVIAAKPQKIVGVTIKNVEVPVLVGLAQNPLLRIRIDTEGMLSPISLTSADLQLTGTVKNSDLASLQLLASGDLPSFGEQASPFGDSAKGQVGTHRFVGTQTLQHGPNYFWLICALRDDADLDHAISASCSGLKFSDGTTQHPDNASGPHRFGVALRQSGQDGVHTCRIPGLATTRKGTLIAVYDLRHRSGRDLPGDIDVGMSRSTDGGRTWETTKVVMNMGHDPKWRYDGVGDPAVLVDRNTGTIWVAATWSHGNRSWIGSGPGMSPKETGQLMLVRSDDDGATWSKPINITKQIKRPEWSFVLQGPGKGITMRDGTIVFAAQYQDPPTKRRLPHSTILYSKDHGKTWEIGTGAFADTTEAQVIETEPGVLMLNCRYNRKSARVVMTTRDMGKTWQKHASSEHALIEPRACMASLIDVDQEVGKDIGSVLLFSNPNSTSGRNHITIKASHDQGQTWPKQRQLLLDEGTGAGYSCMSMIDEKTIGILYEGSRSQLTFQRIKLQDVLGIRSHEQESHAMNP